MQKSASAGDYYIAAETSKKLGELFKVDFRDSKRAAEAYQSAAEWYEEEQSPQ